MFVACYDGNKDGEYSTKEPPQIAWLSIENSNSDIYRLEGIEVEEKNSATILIFFLLLFLCYVWYKESSNYKIMECFRCI